MGDRGVVEQRRQFPSADHGRWAHDHRGADGERRQQLDEVGIKRRGVVVQHSAGRGQTHVLDHCVHQRSDPLLGDADALGFAG